MGNFLISKIIVRSALSRFATRLYPFEKREPFSATRGHIENEITLCIMCGICQKKCPTHAITVARAERNWAIEPMKCIQCGECVTVCPVKCLSMAKTYSAASPTKETILLHQETPPPKTGAVKKENA
ncbi:MAG: 4Fe-4S binding protein [Chitinispirillaceae bacterium]|jgi:formate hydrogenlyase subunit 6/NADH:ubiquinone oxidoreductase subunit I